MNHYVVDLVGMKFAVSAVSDVKQTFCLKYLTTAKPDFTVSITQKDISYERQVAAREAALEGFPAPDYSDAQLEITAVQRKIAECLFEHDTIVFHGSCIAVDGVGYLFTAKSGTGKSTHARLWREAFGDRAVMVNDDKPFLQVKNGAVIAYGSPWNGKHGLGNNISVPLRAICILERGEENRIQKISPQQALMMLFQQSQRPRNPGLMPKYMEIIDKLSGSVAFYQLQCNMEPEAALTAYRGMSQEERK